MEDELIYRDICKRLFRLCEERLTPREFNIICRYYFENGYETLESLARFHKVTKERIRQLKFKAERKIRHALNNPVINLNNLREDYLTTECGIDGFYELTQNYYNQKRKIND